MLNCQQSKPFIFYLQKSILQGLLGKVHLKQILISCSSFIFGMMSFSVLFIYTPWTKPNLTFQKKRTESWIKKREWIFPWFLYVNNGFNFRCVHFLQTFTEWNRRDKDLQYDLSSFQQLYFPTNSYTITKLRFRLGIITCKKTSKSRCT